MEKTLIIIKPGAVARGLTGKVLSRFEERGLGIVSLRMMTITRELAVKHYAEHEGKPFFEGLVSVMTASPVVVGVLVGENAVAAVRRMAGATNPVDAPPGSIRGDFGLTLTDNIVHASDSTESAAREISIFFADGQ